MQPADDIEQLAGWSIHNKHFQVFITQINTFNPQSLALNDNVYLFAGEWNVPKSASFAGGCNRPSRCERMPQTFNFRAYRVLDERYSI